MKVANINVNNFRQYYGSIDIDLNTVENRNIVVIGGKNGYGKTNLLLSIVWCLYGNKISQIDDNFKKEILKEKNYSSFMQQSINWKAKKEGKDSFSISIIITDTEIPDLKGLSSKNNGILIERTFNVSSMDEKLSIKHQDTKQEVFDNDDDKINFINDYVIPLDAAKFVFFDAEKISEIANLSIKDEGSFINDALGKILGLDIYEDLIEDLQDYINDLRREGASKNLQEQIINSEKAIELANYEIVNLDEENAEYLKGIDDLKKKIREYNGLITQNSKKGNSTDDRSTIVTRVENLKEKELQLTEKFSELSEIIPLAILTGKLEEINEHLEVQELNDFSRIKLNDNTGKIDNFIEVLFNKPPEPENSTMSFKDKMFYYDKARALSSELFQNGDEFTELEFDHDLNNAEKRLILDALNLVNTQSKELFETTIDEFNRTKIELLNAYRILNKIDADLEDELILEYSSKKDNFEREISTIDRQIGINTEKIDKLRKEIIKRNQLNQSLILKVEINQKNQLKINKSKEYLDVLRQFVHEQKELKKESLAKNILEEMQKLMHKLKTNEKQFVSDVQVTILAEGSGMKVTLYNSDDEEIKKEVLSQGEKQLYISSLIKAILKESIQSLPIFIDTPLGRLDDEHIKNILLYYYPNLSEQVVILSTNNEITPKRFKDISDNVSKSYLLINDGENTTIKNDYFKSYEN